MDPSRAPLIKALDLLFCGNIIISETSIPTGLIRITIAIQETLSTDVIASIYFFPLRFIIFGNLLKTIEKYVCYRAIWIFQGCREIRPFFL